MERDEWGTWADDLRNRLPALGEYIWKLDKKSRDIWFDEIFSKFDLRDAMQLNYRLFNGEIEIPPKYEWDLLPRFINRQLLRIQAERIEAQRKPGDQPHVGDSSGAMQYVTKHPSCSRVYHRLCDELRLYREKHGKHMPNDVYAQICKRVWAEEEALIRGQEVQQQPAADDSSSDARELEHATLPGM